MAFLLVRLRQILPSIFKQARFLSTGGVSVQKSTQLFIELSPAEICPKEIYPLAGLDYLPSAHSPNFPKFLAGPRKNFPHALQVVNGDHLDATGLAQQCRKVLDNDLTKYGVVLFRGLPFDTEQLETFTLSLGYTPMSYSGGIGFKPSLKEDSFLTIPSDDKRINLEGHNEMAYWHKHPSKVFFYCLKPAKEGCGGLTPIILNKEVFSRLDPEVIHKIEQKGIRYIRKLHHIDKTPIDPALSWQAVLKTDSRKEVENKLKQFNVSFEWDKSDESLRYWYNRPAFVNHPKTAERVFFNQIENHHASYLRNTPHLDGLTIDDHQLPIHTTYGDGEEVEPEVLDHIRVTKWTCAVAFQWKKGDLMVIDNFNVMHGRLSFTGERSHLAYMTSD